MLELQPFGFPLLPLIFQCHRNSISAQGSAKRIHGCDGPVGDADCQQEEGDDGVEEGGHDVADGPEEGERERGSLFQNVLSFETSK